MDKNEQMIVELKAVNVELTRQRNAALERSAVQAAGIAVLQIRMAELKQDIEDMKTDLVEVKD